jgi:hypothetical protein
VHFTIYASFKPHLVPNEQSVIFFRRIEHKIVLLDPYFAEKETAACPSLHPQIVLDLEFLALPFGVVRDGQLNRPD